MPSNKVVINVRLRVNPKHKIRNLRKEILNISVIVLITAFVIILANLNRKSPSLNIDPPPSYPPFAEGLHIETQGNLSLDSVYTDTLNPGQMDVWYYDNWDHVNVWVGIIDGANPNCKGSMDFYIYGKTDASGSFSITFDKATDIGAGEANRSLSLQGGGLVQVFGYNPNKDWLTFCSQPFDYAFTIQSAN